MPPAATTTYSPVVDPRDPCSLPTGLEANDEVHVPLTPRRGAKRTPPPWLRPLVDRHRVVATFCYSDRKLLQWDATPGAAEAWVCRMRPAAAITLDVPLYGFMTGFQRRRALARTQAAYVRALRAWEPLGIETIPLVKGLGAAEWQPQVTLARALGVRRVAFYVREVILERDLDVVASFLKLARAERLRPVLVGAFSPRAPRDTGFDAAASHHYVLARRRRILDRAGRALPIAAGTYSDLLRRFVDPDDVSALTSHNFRRARSLLERGANIGRWTAAS